MRALFFGDSLVAGKGDPEGLGWVGRLPVEAPDGGRVEILNFGVPGETSSQVLARWRAETEPALATAGETVVIFSFGANDATEESGSLLVEPGRSRENLAAALDGAQELELPAMVVGPAPIENDAQYERILALSDAFEAICSESGVPFVPVARGLIAQGDWVREARAGDGAHPRVAGYRAMTRLVQPHWERWITSSDRRPPHPPVS